MSKDELREEKKRNLRRGILTNIQENELTEKKSQLTKQNNHFVYIGLVVLVIVLCLGASVISYILSIKTYTNEETVWEKPLSIDGPIKAVPFCENALIFGNNSVSYVDSSGETVWLKTIEMTSPTVDIAGEYAVIADTNSNRFAIFNKQGCTGEVESPMPISKAVISEKGIAVVVVDDGKAGYIYYYDSTGRKIDIEIKRLLEEGGYPFEVAVSPDGQSLAVSYVRIENNVMNGSVVFYNFNQGADLENKMVSAFDLGDHIAARIKMLDDNTVVAFSDNALTYYSMSNKRIVKKSHEIPFENTVQSIFYNNTYLGVILNNPAGSSDTYKMKVFDKIANEVLDKDISFEYNSISFSNNEIVLFNYDNYYIYRINGRLKYKGVFGKDRGLIVGTSKRNTYLIVEGAAFKEIKVK